MSRARAALKVAKAAAYGGGGVTLLTGAFVGLIMAEAKIARLTIGTPLGLVPPDADGRYGAEFGGQPLRLVLLGDSTAAGLGVDEPVQTPGALLAAGLAALVERPVDLVIAAKVGSQTCDLAHQLDQVLTGDQAAPQVAVVMVGANDVTHRVQPATSVRLLSEAVGRLREVGCEVVVGTCPDLGTLEPIAQPLRWLARRWSRRLAAAQTIAVVEAGGRTVSLGDLLGPEFAARPKEMFAIDRFHPSAAGYEAAVRALLPTVSAALGLTEAEDESQLAVRSGASVLPVEFAAVAAAGTAGTEVNGSTVAGRAEVRHRDQLPLAEPVEAAETVNAAS